MKKGSSTSGSTSRRRSRDVSPSRRMGRDRRPREAGRLPRQTGRGPPGRPFDRRWGPLMRLTPAQRRLADVGSEAQQKALRILRTLGDLYGAKRLLPITSAHVSGVSYKMIGDAGLEFLEDFARDAKVAVPTTVNPLGTDLA